MNRGLFHVVHWKHFYEILQFLLQLVLECVEVSGQFRTLFTILFQTIFLLCLFVFHIPLYHYASKYCSSMWKQYCAGLPLYIYKGKRSFPFVLLRSIHQHEGTNWRFLYFLSVRTIPLRTAMSCLLKNYLVISSVSFLGADALSYIVSVGLSFGTPSLGNAP